MAIKHDFSKEIESGLWDVSQYKLEFLNLKSLPICEQELHINIDRETGNADICCSHSNWITKLKKNSLFKVRSVLVSKLNNKILSVEGYLKGKFITIRRAGK